MTLLQKELAQFPLELVVFPNEVLPLHIFEPRYKDLIDDVLDNVVSFGVTPVIDGKLMGMGTAMKLVRVHKRYEDGRLDIMTKGLYPYVLKSFEEKTEQTTYGMAQVEMLPLKGKPDGELADQIFKVVTEVFTMMQVPQKNFIQQSADPYLLGHKIGLTIEEEYTLLGLVNYQNRQQYILDKLLRLRPQVKELDRIRKQIEMNGHFRNLQPPRLD